MANQLNLNSTALEELKAKAAALPEFIDTSDATATASDMLNGETAYVNGIKVTGNIPSKTSSDLSASGATVTVPAGHYASQATKSVTTVSRASTTISTVANDTNDTLTYTASNNQGTGYVTGSDQKATKTVTLSASGATVTASDGRNSISKSVTTASRANTTISTTANDTNDTLTLTASNDQSTGYVTGSNKTATATITLTTSGATATMSDGSKSVSKSVATVTRANTTISTIANDTNDTLIYTASNDQGTGYVIGADKTATKTVTLTISGATATMSDGSMSVSKSVATATQATPTINVNATNGVITSSATQTAGYVAEGTKSAEPVQLTTQAAKTVTPTKSSQTAVAKNVYTTGEVKVGAIPDEYIIPSGTKNITANGTHDVTQYAQAVVSVEPMLHEKTVRPGAEGLIIRPDTGYDGLSTVFLVGDSDLIPENIKSGISIFNVMGTLEGLPDGISAMKTGTITPTSNSGSLMINHNLGVLPNFSACVVLGDYSTFTEKGAAYVSFFYNPNSSSVVSSAQTYSFYYDPTTGNFGRGAQLIASASTTTQSPFPTSGDAPFVAGREYFWVVAKIDNAL